MTTLAPTPLPEITVEDFLQPARDGENALVAGDRVARTLQRLIDLAETLRIATPEAIACVARLQQEVATAPFVSTPTDSELHPLYRRLTVKPIWSGLIPSPAEPDCTLDVFRSVILFGGLAARQLKKPVSMRRLASAFRLARPSKVHLPGCIALASKLRQKLVERDDSGLGVRTRLDVRIDFFRSYLTGWKTSERVLRDFQVLLRNVVPEAALQDTRNAARSIKKLLEDNSPVQLQLFGAQGTVDTARDGLPGSEVEARGSYVCAEADALPTNAAQADEAERSLALWLRDQGFSGSERVLDLHEARAAVRELLSIAESDTTLRGEAALCLILSALTSKDSKQICKAVWRTIPAYSRDALFIHPEGIGWSSGILPQDRGRWKLANADKSLWMHFDRAESTIWFGIPERLAGLLRSYLGRARSRGNRSKYVISEPYSTLEPHLAQVCLELRTGNPRLTAPRLRAVRLAFAMEMLRDVPLAQLWGGQALGLSPAGLDYLVMSIERMRIGDNEFLLKYFEEHPSPLPKGSDTNGILAVSDLGCLNGQYLREEVGKLIDTTRRQCRRRHKGTVPSQLRRRVQGVAALARYTFWLLAAAQGHRLTERTASATIYDFLPTDRIALVTDKIVDVPHLARVTALCDLAVDQLRAYCGALADLDSWLGHEQSRRRSKLTKDLQEVIQAALTGAGPLFLQLESTNRLAPASVQDLSSDGFAGLPRNVLRHRFVRRLRELGASPDLVALQMGHWYGQEPYGDEGLYTPADFSNVLAPLIQQHLEHDGWEVIRTGRTSPYRPLDYWAPDWSGGKKFRKALERIESASRDLRMRILKAGREYKPRFAEAFQHAVREQVGIDITSRNNEGVVSLSQKDLEKVASSLRAAFSETIEQELALDDFLRRRLLALRRRHGWKTPLIPKRREVSTDLPAIMGFNIRALHDTRIICDVIYGDHAKFSSADVANSASPLDLAVSALFWDLGITHIPTLLAALRGLKDQVQFSACPGTCILIVPSLGDGAALADATSNSRDRALPLSGRPAAAVIGARAYLFKKNADSPPNSPEKVLESLHRLLPPKLRCSRDGALQVYAEIVDLKSRLEKFGPSMMSQSPSSGSVPLTGKQTAALWQNGHVKKGSTAEFLDESALTTEDPQDDARVPEGDRGEYKALTKRLRMLDELKHGGVERTQILYGTDNEPHDPELMQMLSTPRAAGDDSIMGIARGQGNVALIARFVLHLTRRPKGDLSGTSAAWQNGLVPHYERLAPSYIRHHLSTWAPDLLRRLEGRYLSRINPDDLEVVYENVVRCKPKLVRHRTFDVLLEFHRHLRWLQLIPAVSFSDIAEDLPGVTLYAEPGFISAAQYHAAVEQLRIWALRAKAKGKVMLARRLAMSRLALVLMYKAGLRIGETQKVRGMDLYTIGTHVYLWLRPSKRLGRLKSRAARRLLPLSNLLSASELQDLLEWREIEKREQGRAADDFGPVFSDPCNPAAAIGSTLIGRILSCVLRLVTGDPEARPHWLRHSRAMAWLAPMLPGTWAPAGLDAERERKVSTLPSAAMIGRVCHYMGHTKVSTTLTSYEHIRCYGWTDRHVGELATLSTPSIARHFRLQPNLVRSRRRAHKRFPQPERGLALAAYSIRAQNLPIQVNWPRRYWPQKALPFPTPKRRTLSAVSILELLHDLQHEGPPEDLWPVISRRYSLSTKEGLRLFDWLWDRQAAANYWMISAGCVNELRRICGARPHKLADAAGEAGQTLQLNPVKKLLAGLKRPASSLDASTRHDIQSLLRCYDGQHGFRFLFERDARLKPRVLAKLSGTETTLDRHLWVCLLAIQGLLVIQKR